MCYPLLEISTKLSSVYDLNLPWASTRESQNSLQNGNTPFANSIAQEQHWAESTLSRTRIDLIRASSDQDGSIHHNKQLYCADKNV